MQYGCWIVNELFVFVYGEWQCPERFRFVKRALSRKCRTHYTFMYSLYYIV